MQTDNRPCKPSIPDNRYRCRDIHIVAECRQTSGSLMMVYSWNGVIQQIVTFVLHANANATLAGVHCVSKNDTGVAYCNFNHIN